MRELSGQKVSLNTALRQNQLWFPVTSSTQNVRCKLKGRSNKNGGTAQQKTLLLLQILTTILTVHCDGTRDTGTKSDYATLQTLGYFGVKMKEKNLCFVLQTCVDVQ